MPELTVVSFGAIDFVGDDDSDEGRRQIGGIAVPFGQLSPPKTWTGGGAARHQFQRGAFTRSIRERGHKVRLFYGHATEVPPIGKAVSLTEQDEGLYARFEVPDTAAGNEALTLVRDGYVDGFSVGIDVVRYDDDGGTVLHTESALREISLTTNPAFEDTHASAFAAFGRDPSAPPPLSTAVARRRLSLREKDIH